MTTDAERFVFRAMLAQLEAEPIEDLLPLTCLVCRSELVAWERWCLCPECRYYYPHEMMVDADPVTWRAIQLGKLACQRCEQVLPNVPRVHIDDDGLPMPCPVPPYVPPTVTLRERVADWLASRRAWLADKIDPRD